MTLKHTASALLLTAMLAVALTSCAGEDRRGERPLAPVVRTVAANVSGTSCEMEGLVTESRNSELRECGFVYGMGDTLTVKIVQDKPAASFTSAVDSLGGGEYYCVAYARNGIGTTFGDTLHFTISAEP